MKFEIYKFNKVTSTNDIAIDLIRKKKKLSGYIYADTQTKGRGSRGRKWISKTGNLFSSLFFYFHIREAYLYLANLYFYQIIFIIFLSALKK